MLSSGQQGSRAQVPWSLVGDGWALATWSSAPTEASAPASQTVYLIDPDGGEYDLGAGPGHANLTDISGDGTHAAFEAEGSASSQGMVEDLQTGAVATFSLSDSLVGSDLYFSKPDGLAVIVDGSNEQGGVTPAQRLNLSGGLEQSYPTSFPGAGQATGEVAESPDGTQLAMQTTGGIEMVTNSGQGVRFLASPNGTGFCSLVKWWQPADVLLNCSNGLWAQPVAGGTPSRVTNPTDGESDLDAWVLSSGTYTEGAACGTTWISKVNDDLSTTHLSIPGTPAGGSVDPVGSNDSQLAILLQPGCEDGPNSSAPKTNELGWYEPTSNTVTPLLGIGANGGWVDGAVVLGSTPD